MRWEDARRPCIERITSGALRCPMREICWSHGATHERAPAPTLDPRRTEDQVVPPHFCIASLCLLPQHRPTSSGRMRLGVVHRGDFYPSPGDISKLCPHQYGMCDCSELRSSVAMWIVDYIHREKGLDTLWWSNVVCNLGVAGWATVCLDMENNEHWLNRYQR